MKFLYFFRKVKTTKTDFKLLTKLNKVDSVEKL